MLHGVVWMPIDVGCGPLLQRIYCFSSKDKFLYQKQVERLWGSHISSNFEISLWNSYDFNEIFLSQRPVHITSRFALKICCVCSLISRFILCIFPKERKRENNKCVWSSFSLQTNDFFRVNFNSNFKFKKMFPIN